MHIWRTVSITDCFIPVRCKKKSALYDEKKTTEKKNILETGSTRTKHLIEWKCLMSYSLSFYFRETY